jgi:glucokinase
VQATAPERGGAAVLADLRELAVALCDEARRREMDPVAIGIGVCELVDRQGRIVSEATIRWKDVAVDEDIRSATRIPTYIDADVRAAARAEATFGAGRGFDVFLYVTIGTGISSCLVLDGVPYEGACGLVGTFASSPGLIPTVNGELAGGPSLEEYAAGPALASRFAERRAGFAGSARDVIALAEAGDIDAAEIVQRAGGAVGAAVAHLVNVLDPAAVILGGGLGLAGGQYRGAMGAVLRCYVWSERHRDVPLLDGQLGTDAGWIGAALFAASRHRMRA